MKSIFSLSLSLSWVILLCQCRVVGQMNWKETAWPNRLAWRDWVKPRETSVRISCVLTGTPTDDIPNTSLGLYLFTSTVFWGVTPCSPVRIHWRFGETYCLHLQDRKMSRLCKQQETDGDRASLLTWAVLRLWGWRQDVASKHLLTSTELHGRHISTLWYCSQSPLWEPRAREKFEIETDVSSTAAVASNLT
jgi:hypothetical protein